MVSRREYRGICASNQYKTVSLSCPGSRRSLYGKGTGNDYPKGNGARRFQRSIGALPETMKQCTHSGIMALRKSCLGGFNLANTLLTAKLVKEKG